MTNKSLIQSIFVAHGNLDMMEDKILKIIILCDYKMVNVSFNSIPREFFELVVKEL